MGYEKIITDSKSSVSGGGDLSLVTTGEKYNWNNKIAFPSGGSSGNALVYDSAGNAKWSDTVYKSTWSTAIERQGVIDACVREYGQNKQCIKTSMIFAKSASSELGIQLISHTPDSFYLPLHVTISSKYGGCRMYDFSIDTSSGQVINPVISSGYITVPNSSKEATFKMHCTTRDNGAGVMFTCVVFICNNATDMGLTGELEMPAEYTSAVEVVPTTWTPTDSYYNPTIKNISIVDEGFYEDPDPNMVSIISAVENSFAAAGAWTLFSGTTTNGYEAGWYGFKHGTTNSSAILFIRGYMYHIVRHPSGTWKIKIISVAR